MHAAAPPYSYKLSADEFKDSKTSLMTVWIPDPMAIEPVWFTWVHLSDVMTCASPVLSELESK